MLVLEDAILKKENRKNFVALGSFDGLHKGHLSLIRKIKQLAEEGKGQSIVYTFKNHPRKFININSTLNLLMTNEAINVHAAIAGDELSVSEEIVNLPVRRSPRLGRRDRRPECANR